MHGLVVSFLSKKLNIYGTEMVYLKVINHCEFEEKMEGLVVEGLTMVMPFWKSDRGYYILKAKSKHVEEYDFTTGTMYLVDAVFEKYAVDNRQGYYAKIKNISKRF